MTLITLRPVLIAALLLAHAPAHAASFNCNKGRSLTETMICHDPALSKLDDTLGQLYWTARRRVIHGADRRAFLADSDSKWAWREANCRDAACLGSWYATRIGELQQLIASMQVRSLPPDNLNGVTPAVMPADPSNDAVPTPAPLPRSAPLQTQMVTLQCTAANPGIVMNEQCPTVLKENGNRWKYQPRGRDWFCGVAMLPPAVAPDELSMADQPAR